MSENLAQALVVESFQQYGKFTLSFQSAKESVKKLGRHHNKHLSPLSLALLRTSEAVLSHAGGALNHALL